MRDKLTTNLFPIAACISSANSSNSLLVRCSLYGLAFLNHTLNCILLPPIAAGESERLLLVSTFKFFAVKIASYDLGFIPFLGEVLSIVGISEPILIAPVGVIVFPFTLQITDMVNEKFGRKAVYDMIWIALVCQVIMVIFVMKTGIIKKKRFSSIPLLGCHIRLRLIKRRKV